MKSVIITEIKSTKKGRHALFCGDGYLFSVEDRVFEEFSLCPGMKLEGDTFEALFKEADRHPAHSKAIRLLSIRAHSEKELCEKLMAVYDRFTSEQVVSEMALLGYVDDKAYAEDCVRHVIARKGMSERAAEQYLRKRGIDGETAALVLSGYGGGEMKRIGDLIEKSYAERLKLPNGRPSVHAALARRGFSGSDIRRALDEFLSDEEE